MDSWESDLFTLRGGASAEIVVPIKDRLAIDSRTSHGLRAYAALGDPPRVEHDDPIDTAGHGASDRVRRANARAVGHR